MWFEPIWLALVQLGARAAPACGALVEDARKRTCCDTSSGCRWKIQI